jgi:hypothetical protein
MSRIGGIGVAAACIAANAAASAPELALPPPPDGTIGVYADSEGTQPCATVDSFATLYVIAKVEGASAGGITGTEFRIEVEHPAGWTFAYSAPPDADVRMGNPMDLDPQKPDDGAGVRIAFAACKEPVKGKIDLGTIFVTRAGGSPTLLVVKRHAKPSNTQYPCALFTLCDSPVFSKSCVSAVLALSDSCGLHEVSGRSPDAAVFVAGLNVPGTAQPPCCSAGASGRGGKTRTSSGKNSTR